MGEVTDLSLKILSRSIKSISLFIKGIFIKYFRQNFKGSIGLLYSSMFSFNITIFLKP